MIWLTGDGGNTWLPFNIRTSPKLVSLFSGDIYTGWAVGENGLIVRTDDGGYSWQRLSGGGREDVNDISFFDSTVGISIGSRGRIWLTTTPAKTGCPSFHRLM